MVQLLNETFGTNYTVEQIKRYYYKHGLKCGLGSTHMPIGTVSFVESSQMYFVKIADGPNPQDNWRPKHELVWEEAYGAIPEGHVVIFLDGDRSNCVLENLALCSKAVNLEMNRKKLRFSNAEATRAGLLITQIRAETRKREKKGVKKG